jgi:trans-aconitate 2-methyltransferase
MERAATDWDAGRYDRLAAPQEAWGRATLERLPLAGGETVVDAGCGSGRVTRLLLERLPKGRVIAVDASPSMIEAARTALADQGDRVELVLSDLTELSLEETVDAVFSNATFHWIADHGKLFGCLHAALRPGGALVAQCGGEGNVAEWQEAVSRAQGRPEFAPSFAGWEGPWNFASPEETAGRLRAAGFEGVRTWLEERVVEPEDPRDFVAVSGLAAHHERLAPELRERFTDAVLDGVEQPVRLRYVRLNIEARRPL